MDTIPPSLKYTRTHEWIRPEENGDYTVGISDHAQDRLGDVVYVSLPAPDTRVKAGEPCTVIESVKSASDIHAPLSGVITAVNDRLAEDPALINHAPYGEGWLFRLRPAEQDTDATLLDADAYRAFLNE